MSVDEVYMDVPAVRDMAKNFQTMSEVVNLVGNVVEGLIMTLNTTAFIGRVGGEALANFLESIKPLIEKVAQKCAEFSTDIDASVDAFERGDELGAARFY